MSSTLLLSQAEVSNPIEVMLVSVEMMISIDEREETPNG